MYKDEKLEQAYLKDLNPSTEPKFQPKNPAEDQIVCKFHHYEMRGIALLNNWGGGLSTIDMKPTQLKSAEDFKEGINDNGFGCESIAAAKIYMYAVYIVDGDEDNVGYKKLIDVFYYDLNKDSKDVSEKIQNYLDSGDDAALFK